MNIQKAHVLILSFGLLIQSTVSTPVETTINNLEQSELFYKKSLGYSTLSALPTGAIYGYANSCLCKASDSFFKDVPFIRFVLNNILISYWMLHKQEQAISVLHNHALKHHIPYDKEVAFLIALLAHIVTSNFTYSY
jgi:hypothetical protein